MGHLNNQIWTKSSLFEDLKQQRERLDERQQTEAPETQQVVSFVNRLATAMRLHASGKLPLDEDLTHGSLSTFQSALGAEIVRSSTTLEAMPAWQSELTLELDVDAILKNLEASLTETPLEPRILLDHLVGLDEVISGLTLADVELADLLLNDIYFMVLSHIKAVATISESASYFIETHRPSGGLGELWWVVASSESRLDFLNDETAESQTAESQTAESAISSKLMILLNSLRSSFALPSLSDVIPPIAYASESIDEPLPSVQELGTMIFDGINIVYLLEHYNDRSDLVIHSERAVTLQVRAGEQRYEALDDQSLIVPLVGQVNETPLELYANGELIKTFTVVM